MVLKWLQAVVFDLREKFWPNWIDPYIVKVILYGGVAKLMNLDGDEELA